MHADVAPTGQRVEQPLERSSRSNSLIWTPQRAYRDASDTDTRIPREAAPAVSSSDTILSTTAATPRMAAMPIARLAKTLMARDLFVDQNKFYSFGLTA